MNSGQEAFEQVPDNFDASAENGMRNPESAVDARANDNAETQRMRGELEGFFEQQTNVVAEEIGEKEPEVLSPELEELKDVTVPKDAGSMPSAFASKAQSIIDKSLNKDKDPAAAVEELCNIRWTYMEKVFGRKLGDGLNGNKG